MGVREVHARYLPTAKNHRVRDLYPALGFSESPDAGTAPDGRAAVHFWHDLGQVPPVPDHVSLEARFEGLIST
jgi:hypothetical protein